MENVIFFFFFLRELTGSLKNKWYQYLLLVPLPFICIFIKTGRLLPACTMSSVFPVFDLFLLFDLFPIFDLRIIGMWACNEEVLKFCHDGICSLVTSVTRSQGGTTGPGSLCQSLSPGACVRALTSLQCSRRYPVYSSGLALLSLGVTLPFSGACLSEVRLAHHCFLQFIPSYQRWNAALCISPA